MASAWVKRWAHLIKPTGSVLDVACGTGRHTRFFFERGHVVTAVDVSSSALQEVAAHSPTANVVQADIENAPWPFLTDGVPQTFDAVVVTNYLWRPLMSTLATSLGDGSVLIYETFAVGNESVGKPSRANFLLKRGELLALFTGLQIVAFEDGFLPEPDRFVQRLVAVKRTAKMHGLAEPISPARFYL